MRNLKKILALVLALMMVLSVMVTASAADFTDADKITYTEAVEVMAAAGVLKGYTDGSFNPAGTITRAEAAYLTAYVLLGEAGVKDLVHAETDFTDEVPGWASGAIAYCAEEGIINGNPDGTFNAKGTIISYGFAKLLLGALGIEGEYTGNNWKLNVATAAKTAGLLAGLPANFLATNGNADITREQAAQMTFNAMQVGGVETITYYVVPATNADGVITGYVAKYTDITDAYVMKNVLGADFKVEYKKTTSGTLMSKFYVQERDLATDAYGRPETIAWEKYDFVNEEWVDAYVEYATPVKTYTNAVDYKTIAADLKGYTLGGAKVEGTTTISGTVGFNMYNSAAGLTEYNLTGNDLTPSARLAALTKNGRVVEIYADSYKAITGIVVTHYSVGEIEIADPDQYGNVVYSIGANDYNDYSDAYIAAVKAATGVTLADEIALNGEIKHEDHITYITVDGVVQVYPTTTVEGILSRKTATGEFLTIGGEKIAVGNSTGATAYGTYEIKTTAQKFVLDQYGYVVALYTDGTPDTVYSNDFVYVLAIQAQGHVAAAGGDLIAEDSGYKAPIAKAVVVLADGTYGVVDLAVTATPTLTPGVYTYSYDKPATDGTVVEDASLNGEGANVALAAGGIGNWFAYTVTESGAYVLEALAGASAHAGANIDVNTKYLPGDAATFGGIVTSSTKITALKVNADNSVTVSELAGVDADVVLDKENVMYTVNALDGTVTSILMFGFAPTAYIAPDYVLVAAKGDQVGATTYEYTVFMGGEVATIVVADGTLTAGAVLTVADINAQGVYTLAPVGNLVDGIKVTVSDKTFYVANSTQYVYDRYCEIYNVTTGATGAADVVEVNDYVVAFDVDSDLDVDLVYIVDKPEV